MSLLKNIQKKMMKVIIETYQKIFRIMLDIEFYLQSIEDRLRKSLKDSLFRIMAIVTISQFIYNIHENVSVIIRSDIATRIQFLINSSLNKLEQAFQNQEFEHSLNWMKIKLSFIVDPWWILFRIHIVSSQEEFIK